MRASQSVCCVEEEGNPAVAACSDPVGSGQMLNFVTATKLYRVVPQDFPDQVSILTPGRHFAFLLIAANLGCLTDQLHSE